MSNNLLIVYFSSPTGNTRRFVESLGFDAICLPTGKRHITPLVHQKFILITPTYAHDDGLNAVPKPVIRFLNEENNRNNMVGVIGAGNRNFGHTFALAADVISRKCGVPLLHKFELFGNEEDRQKVIDIHNQYQIKI